MVSKRTKIAVPVVAAIAAAVVAVFVIAQYAALILAQIAAVVKAPVPSIAPIRFDFGNLASGNDYSDVKVTGLRIDWLGKYAWIDITGFKFEGTVNKIKKLDVTIEVLNHDGSVRCKYEYSGVVENGTIKIPQVDLTSDKYCKLRGVENPPAVYNVRVTVSLRTDVVQQDTPQSLTISVKLGYPYYSE